MCQKKQFNDFEETKKNIYVFALLSNYPSNMLAAAGRLIRAAKTNTRPGWRDR